MATDFQALPVWKRVGVIIAIVAIIGAVSAELIPALSTQGRPITAAANSAVFGFLLWPFLLAYWLGCKRPWLYPILGLMADFAIAVVGGAAKGYERRTKLLSNSERLYLALDKFDAETGKAARAASRDEVKAHEIIDAAMARAAQRASDESLSKMLVSSFSMIETKDGPNLPRCVATFMGTPQQPATAAEVDATLVPLIEVFESAVLHPEAIPLDRERAAQIVSDAWQKADTGNVLADEAKLNSLPDSEKCALLIRYVHILKALPQSDAGLVMRHNVLPAVTP